VDIHEYMRVLEYSQVLQVLKYSQVFFKQIPDI